MRYRQKPRYHRVKTNTHTKVYIHDKRMQMKKHLINHWWRDRHQKRRIYSPNYEAIVQQGKDYTGVLPWPDTVSFRSLYEDFMLTDGRDSSVSAGEFCVHMHKITKIPAGEKVVRYKVADWSWRRTLTHLSLPR